MRSYHSPDPIILSVGEEDEVSIADVAYAIAGSLFYLHYHFINFINSNQFY